MTVHIDPGTFDDLYGLEVEVVTADEARARVEVCDKVRQPAGLVHGGVYAAIAEALSTGATMHGIAADQFAVGLSNNTSFLRPVSEGTLHAHAQRLHRGRTTWVWDVQIRDDNQRLCAVTRMTVAVRPRTERAAAR